MFPRVSSCGSCANGALRALGHTHHLSDICLTMEVEMENTDEIQRLKGCINDLISVLALPAIWNGREPSHIVSTLLDVLLGMLRLDFAYARVSDPVDGSPIEVVRLAQRRNLPAQPQEVGRLLNRWLTGDPPASPLVVPNPIGEGEVSIAPFRLGLQDEVGGLVAGSRRADFPTKIEMLLLQVATNQAAIGLREARLLSDQRRAEKEIRLLLTITQAVDESEDFRSGLGVALRKVCEATGWAYGEGWIPRADGTVLEFGSAWHASAKGLDRFRKLSEECLFPPGMDLPGRVWESKRSEWIQDFLMLPENTFPRCKLASDFGLKTALGIPVIANDKTVAVLAFFTFESREEDKRLFELVSAVASQVGSVIQRKRAEEALRKAREGLEIRVQERTAELAKTNEALHAEIVERMQTEEALRRTEAELRWVTDSVPDCLWSAEVDKRGQFICRYCSPVVERITGYPPEFYMQSPQRWSSTVYPEDRPRLEQAYLRITTGQSDHVEEEYRIILPDGTTRWVRDSANARRLDDGTFRLDGVVSDISQRKRDEDEKARLQKQVIENSRLAAIGATTANIAHEIGNPLNGMSVTAQMLERRLSQQGTHLDEAVQCSLRSLREEIRRLNDLLAGLRTLSRREEYHFQPTFLAVIAGEVFAMEKENYAGKGIRVEQVFREDLPPVRADRDKLKQALWNLCKNAAEAMPRGGTLRLSAYSSGTDVVLEIGDTGVGIPPGVDIFGPFTTTKTSGSGLGLVVVRQVVAAHGGDLSYTSEPGRGATFHLTLPQASLERVAC